MATTPAQQATDLARMLSRFSQLADALVWAESKLEKAVRDADYSDTKAVKRAASDEVTAICYGGIAGQLRQVLRGEVPYMLTPNGARTYENM